MALTAYEAALFPRSEELATESAGDHKRLLAGLHALFAADSDEPPGEPSA